MSRRSQTSCHSGLLKRSKSSRSRGKGSCGSLGVRRLSSSIQSQSPTFWSTPKHRFRLRSWSHRRRQSTTWPRRGIRGALHVREDHDAILGEVQVRLQRVRADLDGVLERPERVLGVLRFVPAVRDGLREAAAARILTL